MTMHFLQKGVLFIFLSMLIGQELVAQKIQFDLPQHKGKQVVLLSVNGVHKDTLQKVGLDKDGKGNIDLQKIKEKVGLIELFIKADSPPNVNFQWVYSPIENPTIISNEFYVNHENAQIKNSLENAAIERWFSSGFNLKQKKDLIQELLKMYQPNEAFYAHLNTEWAQITKQQNLLYDTIQQSPLYAATLLKFREDIEQKLSAVWESNDKRNQTRAFFQSIDFEKLYHTGLWFEVINPCIEAYIKGSGNYEQFGKDIVAGLKRTNYLPAYSDLADAAISVCEQFSWWTDEKEIASFIVADNRLIKPTGRLVKAMKLQQVSEGAKAPDLVVTRQSPTPEIRLIPSEQLSEKFTLLVFHETGCGNCENLLEQLKGNYTDLKKNGVRVISFAADHTAETFAKMAVTLPWEDKFCDFKGFEGINFKNYAVLGTPTLYLLDKNGKIITKTATLDEIIRILNEKKS